MVNREIINSLKIAIERGESIEKATASMANAGYNKQELQEAAESIKASGEMGMAAQMPKPEH